MSVQDAYDKWREDLEERSTRDFRDMQDRLAHDRVWHDDEEHER